MYNKKTKQVLIVMTYLVFVSTIINGQNNDESYMRKNSFSFSPHGQLHDMINKSDSLRHVFINMDTGLFEFFSFGIGLQACPKFAFTIKHSYTWISGGGSAYTPGIGKGLGLRINYFTDIWLFNNLSCNYTYYFQVSRAPDNEYGIKPKGNYFEINIGRENIKTDIKGKLQFYWSIGLGISSIKNTNVLVLPTIKVGIFNNLF
jgi:hypothetical protein